MLLPVQIGLRHIHFAWISMDFTRQYLCPTLRDCDSQVDSLRPPYMNTTDSSFLVDATAAIAVNPFRQTIASKSTMP